jgi:hypothetical protein
MGDAKTAFTTDSPAGTELRAHMSNEAKQLNRSNKLNKHVVVPSMADDAVALTDSADTPDQPALVCMSERSPADRRVPELQPLGGAGCLGVGDTRFGVQLAALDAEDRRCHNSIGEFSKTWTLAHSGRCGEATPFSYSHLPSCLEEFGFCTAVIPELDQHERVRHQLLNLVRDVRQKQLVKGKNKGPDASNRHPLVVMMHETNRVAASATRRLVVPVSGVI